MDCSGPALTRKRQIAEHRSLAMAKSCKNAGSAMDDQIFFIAEFSDFDNCQHEIPSTKRCDEKYITGLRKRALQTDVGFTKDIFVDSLNW
jgi:hypothetical protein